jgi:hypothetical protein
MGFALKLALAIIVAALLGAVLLANSLGKGLDAMSVRNGDWVTSVTTGADDAGAISRAAVSIGGLLASTRENSIYYRLATLSGEPLRLDCRYRVRGESYDADWWSITAYGWDHYLIPNTAGRFSFNNENLSLDETGFWEIIVSASPQTGNWLPVGEAIGERRTGKSDFDLLIRLYTPGDAYLQTPDTAPLPTVEREGCE